MLSLGVVTAPGLEPIALREMQDLAVDGEIEETGLIVARGNLATHRGLCMLASPTADSFYVGYWRDLYRASHELRARDDVRAIGVIGTGDRKYVLAFSGHRAVDLPSDDDVSHAIVAAGDFAFSSVTQSSAQPCPNGWPDCRSVTLGSFNLDATRDFRAALAWSAPGAIAIVSTSFPTDFDLVLERLASWGWSTSRPSAPRSSKKVGDVGSSSTLFISAELGIMCAAIDAKQTATEPGPSDGSNASRTRAVPRRLTS